MSVNSIGVGPPSNTVTATTAEEGEFDLTKFVVVLIAVVVLVCFVVHHSFFVLVPSGPPKSVRVEAVSETELRVSWQVRNNSLAGEYYSSGRYLSPGR